MSVRFLSKSENNSYLVHLVGTGGEVLKNIEGVPQSLSPLSTLLPGPCLFAWFEFLTKLEMFALPCLPCCAARPSGDDECRWRGAEGGGDAAAECHH